MLFREKEALFYDRRVILYSVQVFGSLGRNGVKNTCTAILGVFFIDFNPSIGFITMVLMVVDGASVCAAQVPLALTTAAQAVTATQKVPVAV